MDVLHDLPAELPVSRACDALGVSRATLYRHTAPPVPLTPRTTTPLRRLSDQERDEVVRVLHAPEFVDQPPREIFATLLSQGIYVASVRTMYRVLADLDESQERRRGHVRQAHTMPRLEATAPNQVWTWDITKVHGPQRGVFYFVFVILDLFSRYVVGWLVADTENAKLATHLLSETIKRHEIEPGSLTVHSDRGAPMTAGSMTQLLANLLLPSKLVDG